jgi:hypothetical protein
MRLGRYQNPCGCVTLDSKAQVVSGVREPRVYGESTLRSPCWPREGRWGNLKQYMVVFDGREIGAGVSPPALARMYNYLRQRWLLHCCTWVVRCIFCNEGSGCIKF